MQTQRYISPAMLVVPLALFMAFAIGRIGTMMGQDEISHYYKIARLLFNEGYSRPAELITFSPHGYPLLLLAACRLFGVATYQVMRSVGVACWAIAILFVCWRSRRISAGLILCSMPAVCQAAVLLDIDETVLVPACILLWSGSLAYVHACKSPLRFALAALSLCLALWCRLTTPFIVCAVMLALYRNWRLLAAYALGIALFILSWWLYCRCTGVCFAGPFSYLLVSFLDTTCGARSAGVSKIFHTAICLCLWGMNPMLCLLFLIDGRHRLRRWIRRRRLDELDSAWLCGAAILLGYMVIGGALFGFPKYQCPAFPFVALCIASMMGTGIDVRGKALPLSFFAVLTMFCVAFLFGEPLLFLRYTLREPGAHVNVIWPLLSVLLSYLVMLVLVRYMVARGAGWRMGLLFPAIVFNLCFAYKQNVSRYSTGYIYGERGECGRLAKRIMAKQLDNGILFIPAEISYFICGSDERALNPGELDDLPRLKARIQDEKPDVIALSHLIYKKNTIENFNSDNELQNILLNEYQEFHDCSMRYWFRKEGK